MKAATQAVRDILQKNVEVRALPKLRVEWEHNRYTPIEEVTVTPATDDYRLEWNGTYVLDSITQPNRPGTGIAKARARLNEPLKLISGYRDLPSQTRFYAASDSDIYKYWSSWDRSKATPIATNEYEFWTPIVITMSYETAAISNKIVLGFETSYARPKSYDVEIFEGGSWKEIAQDIIPNAAGQVVLYRKADGSGGWGETPVYDTATYVKGIRLTVRSMNKPNSHLDVIQIGARLENDLSDFVVSYDKTFELSQRSFIAPVGKASSNQASVMLTNYDLRFNNENEDSIYYGLIDKKVKFTMELSIDARPAGSQDERIREFTMYADSWGGQDEDSVTVSLKDSSVFLQEIPMPKSFWENMTIGAIIWQIMDSVGMTNYLYTRDVLDTGQIVPYFWADDGTAWEQISNLAEATQTAVYFDEWDIMQIKTRKSMFGNGNKTINWNLDAVQAGTKLPDIIEVSGDDDLAVNQVNINWKPATYSDFNNGFPKMETVWEPDEDTVVLRASALTRDLLTDSQHMWIKTGEVGHWPYSAMVNIRGEILTYEGKEYAWHKPDGTIGYETVKSLEEKKAVDAKSWEILSWANSWTGRLTIKERGLGGTNVSNHYVRPPGYTGVATNYFNTLFRPVSGGYFYNDGYLSVHPPFNAGPHDYFLLKHQSQISAHEHATYGTRFRFPAQNLMGNWACAGMWIDGDWGDAGYYIEISPTITVEQENREFRNEISLIVMPGNSVHIPWNGGPENNRKGWPANILPGQWYDLDVTHVVNSSGDAVLTVYLDGSWAGSWTIPSNMRPAVSSGAQGVYGHTGLFTRWQTKCDFEYFYGMNEYGDRRNPYGDPGVYVEEPDTSSYLDLVKGGFTSGYIEREWRYGDYMTWNRGPGHEGGYWFGALNSRASYFLDEFGPVVHEMREFNVSFDEDKIPTAHSYLFLSNESQASCIDYNSNAFGAKFTLVNTSRRDAVIKGEDRVTAGEDNPIDHKFFIYGRTLYQEDENELIKKDEQSIRRKGVVSLEFNNRHIQTKEAADDLGQWVLDLWAMGADEMRVDVFGNPLYQLGDLVTVNYPAKNMSPETHQYYIVNIDGGHDQGYETSLILRRARL